MERWNYYFKPCHAVCLSGQTVAVAAGHGMVTLIEDADCESVFFPDTQLDLKLLPGEVRRLESSGLAKRFGSVRDQASKDPR